MLRNLSSTEKILLSILTPAILILLFLLTQWFLRPGIAEQGSKLLPLVFLMIGLIIVSTFGLAIYQFREKRRRRKRLNRRAHTPQGAYEFAEE